VHIHVTVLSVRFVVFHPAFKQVLLIQVDSLTRHDVLLGLRVCNADRSRDELLMEPPLVKAELRLNGVVLLGVASSPLPEVVYLVRHAWFKKNNCVYLIKDTVFNSKRKTKARGTGCAESFPAHIIPELDKLAPLEPSLVPVS
jgi:hypothetical protein